MPADKDDPSARDSRPAKASTETPGETPGEAPGETPGPVSRRSFLGGAAAGVIAGVGASYGLQRVLDDEAAAVVAQQAGPASSTPSTLVAPQAEPVPPPSGPLGLPGPFPGKVIETHHPGAVRDAVRDRAAVRAMMDRGMSALVGTDDAVEAWRHLFSPGDRVGIKVVPVGAPHSISSFEVVLEVIEGLVAAGVRKRDILVFERYKLGGTGLVKVGYPDILPDGVHWECSSVEYDDAQLELSGQLPGRGHEDHIAGYDRDVYRELAYCQPAPIHDPKDDRRLRSHLSTIVTRKVDKFISIPVLKDHNSAGITLSLKNLSHGLVNNVARSHMRIPGRDRDGRGGTLNQCGTFIPTIVSLPPIREKAVLQILDGLVATYEGGPSTWRPTFSTWERGSLFFATDPVALDHIGWEIIDEERAARGWPPVAKMGLMADRGTREIANQVSEEPFHSRQPQHVPLAGTLGLGVFERDQIDYSRIELS
ncbi:DUF362 domain-containing protein [Haliangium sp.]|uniref:DUF362 domain-containing protein n=1 Tax=Haliangium sp. TaxID=2663208 RepID=UPI003D124F38